MLHFKQRRKNTPCQHVFLNWCVISTQLNYFCWTHQGWMMHIYITEQVFICSDNGLLPVWHQAIFWTREWNCNLKLNFYTPAQRSWRGVYWIHLVCPSVRLSVRPSVCRRHGFRSISQVCFGISISNFICMLMMAIGRSLLIFSDVTFKMATWRPYWIFWFPDSNFTLALSINFKLQRHNTYVYG